MSENVGSIDYTVSLDTGKMIEGERKVQDSIKRMESGGDRLHAAMTKVSQAITAMFAVERVAAVIRSVVDAARLYESTLADLSAITGATGMDLRLLSDEAKNLAKTTTASSVEVIQAMKLIASAKPELLETRGALAEVTKEAIALAEASGMALPEAANSVALALNQFKEGADQAARYVNVLAAGAKFGASEIAETAVALKNAAVSAAAAGVTFEETNAAIQALAATGIKAGEAGTALRNVLLKLENETDTRLKPSVNGLSGALKNLDTQNLSSAALTKMFGMENVNAAQALIGSASAISTLTVQLTGTQTAYEQAAINTNTLDGSIKRMSNSLELAAQKMGDQLMPLVKATAGAIQSMATQFVEGSDAMTKAATALQVAVILVTGSIVGRLAPALFAFVAQAAAAAVSMGAAAVAARGFGAALALIGGPIGVAISALGLLALNWDKISSKSKSAADIAEDSARRIAKALSSGAEAPMRQLQQVRDGAAVEMAKLDAKLKEASDADKSTGRTSRYGAGKKYIDDLNSAREAQRAAMIDAQKAIDDMKKRQMEELFPPKPAAVAEEKRPPGVDKPKKEKFDQAAYLASLRREQASEIQVINETEKEKLRIAKENRDKRGLDEAAYYEAITLIVQSAEEDRVALMRKAQEQIDQDRQQADERAQRDRQQQADRRSFARQTIASVDPVEAVRFEEEARIAALEEYRLLDLDNTQLYEDAKIAIHQAATQRIKEIDEEAAKAKVAANIASLDSTSNAFGAIAGVLRSSGQEQSGAYKAMFAAQKAFSIASSIVAIQSGLAQAAANPWPLNLAAMATVAASTASIISTISGANYGGGRQYGGPVTGGSMYRVGEGNRPEMFMSGGKQFMIPGDGGRVVPSGQSGGGGVTVQVQVINNHSGAQVSAKTDESGRIAQIVISEIANQVSSNSGEVWSAFRGATNIQGRM